MEGQQSRLPIPRHSPVTTVEVPVEQPASKTAACIDRPDWGLRYAALRPLAFDQVT
jgi:hypothetical protein